jgi:hypothetical protein
LRWLTYIVDIVDIVDIWHDIIEHWTGAKMISERRSFLNSTVQIRRPFGPSVHSVPRRALGSASVFAVSSATTRNSGAHALVWGMKCSPIASGWGPTFRSSNWSVWGSLNHVWGRWFWYAEKLDQGWREPE